MVKSVTQGLQRSIPLQTRRRLSDRFVAGLHNIGYPVLTRLGLSSSASLRVGVKTLCSEVLYYIENHDRDRIDERVLAELLTQPHEYAEENLDAEIPLNQRISGQIVPYLDRVMAEPGIRRALEMGCAGSTIIAPFAAKYPAVQWLGVDFHIRDHVKALERGNLRFEQGYALDLLEHGRLPSPIDVVFFQFTGTLILPKEMERYFQLFKRLGVRYLVMNEPTRKWFPIQLNERRPRSAHLGGRMWKHDYPGLARRAGYEVIAFQYRHWSETIEPHYNRVRYDTYLMQMIARLPG